MLKYGFCQEDDAGNIVSIWNFAELDEALGGIDFDEDQDGIDSPYSQDRALIGNDRLDQVIPRNLVGEVNFLQAVNGEGLESHVDDVTGVASIDLDGNRYLQTASFDVPIELNNNCHHGHQSELALDGVCRMEQGQSRLRMAPCPLCEMEYREFVEDFYADMPALEGPDDFGAMYSDMPDLEPAGDVYCATLDVDDSGAWSHDLGRSTLAMRVSNFCASVILMRLLFSALDSPVPMFVDTLDVFLHMFLTVSRLRDTS